MLDQKALRRDTFSEGYEVELWDKQMWTLPKPRLKFRPILGDDGSVSPGCKSGFGPEYDEKLDILNCVVEANNWDYLTVAFEVLVRLLLANYDLTQQDVSDLIMFDPEDEDNQEQWKPIIRAIRGLVPKPTPDISDSPQ